MRKKLNHVQSCQYYKFLNATKSLLCLKVAKTFFYKWLPQQNSDNQLYYLDLYS